MIDEVIKYLVKGLHFLVQSYWGVLFFLLLGVFSLRYSARNPTTIANLRGWAGAIGFIILALIILYLKLSGQT